MSDRFITFMMVPEKSDRVRKYTVPTIYLRIISVAFIFLAFAGVFIFFDYLHVLSQVAENKRLRKENHGLRTEVQAAKNRLESLDQSVSRLKTFAHKLRVIGNLDSPQSTKILRNPEPLKGDGSSSPGMFDIEDSGDIQDPENNKDNRSRRDTSDYEDTDSNSVHAQLASQRELTLTMGEFQAQLQSQALSEQVAAISAATARLRDIAEIEEQSFAELQELFQDRVDRLLRTPSITPASGWFSSEFGHRYNPYSARRTFHAGIDIANATGTPIYAPADGVISFAGSLGGFGLVIQIDHGYNIVTKYGHNSKLEVKKGSHVKRGDLIAKMGSTGRSTGPHLHYQIEVNKKPVNPRFFMLEDTF